MNPAQRQIADAYSHVFAPGPQTQLVLDDLTVFANSVSESQQPGAIRVLGYILLKRSAMRREKTREKANG